MSQPDPRRDLTPTRTPFLTRRQRLGQRIELAAGIAAGVLALAALALLLFAPLLGVARCGGSAPCGRTSVVYVSALHARLDAGAWALILVPLVLALLGATGAVVDVRYSARAGLFALGLTAGFAALICLVGAAGVVGALYLPATLALALAAYGAFLARSSARTPDHPADRDER